MVKLKFDGIRLINDSLYGLLLKLGKQKYIATNNFYAMDKYIAIKLFFVENTKVNYSGSCTSIGYLLTYIFRFYKL